MAKIKFSALVTDASGSVGGNIFSRNASGPYVKSFTMPHNPNTAKQQAVRTKFAILISLWKALTPAQQQLWADAAPQYPKTDSLGQSGVYTGQQLYNKCNQTLAIVGVAAKDTPTIPKIFSSTAVASLTMDNLLGVLTTGDVVLDAVGTSDEAVIVTITTGLSGGITRPGKNQFKIVKTVSDASVSATIDIVAEYIALYGTPELGAKIYARVDLVNKISGQRLALGQAVTIVTGT